VEAARALEDELGRLESMVQDALRLPLDSQKNLERTGLMLARLGSMEGTRAPRLAALMGAIGELDGRQRARTEALNARVAEFQGRQEAYNALATRYAALGSDAQSLNTLVQEFAARHRDGSGAAAGDVAELHAAANGILERMDQLVASAEQIAQAAAESNFSDVQRQAVGLRQELLAARNRIKQAASRVAQAPARPASDPGLMN
jgi:chromosome segregation ATPase